MNQNDEFQDKYLNLLRDDLGFVSDASNRNFEITSSRGVPLGKWVINLHYYSKGAAVPWKNSLNIPVFVSVEMTETDNSLQSPVQRNVKVFAQTFILKMLKEEKTVATFITNSKGKIIEGTLEFPEAIIPLREAKRK